MQRRATTPTASRPSPCPTDEPLATIALTAGFPNRWYLKDQEAPRETKTRGEKVTKTSKRETRTRCSPNVMASENVRENVPSESFDRDDGGEARQILLMILPRFSPLDRDPL